MRTRKRAWAETHIQAGGVHTRQGTLERANALKILTLSNVIAVPWLYKTEYIRIA